MPTPLVVLYGNDAPVMALVALGFAIGCTRLGRHVVLVDADTRSTALSRVLGHGGLPPGERGPSFAGLLRGEPSPARPLGTGEGFAPRAGLWWLPALGLGERPGPAPQRKQLPALAQALAPGMEALRCGDHAPDLVVVCAPAGASREGILLGALAQAMLVYSDDADTDPASVFVDSLLPSREPAPLRLDLHLDAPESDHADGIWVDTDGVFRGQLPRLPRIERERGWGTLAKVVLDALALPEPEPEVRYERHAQIHDVDGCTRAFAALWGQDREAAVGVFKRVCNRRGGPLEAAVGAVRAVEHNGEDVPPELLKVAVQRLRLSEPSYFAEELYRILSRRVGWVNGLEPEARQDLLTAAATAAVHWAQYLGTRRQPLDAALRGGRKMLEAVMAHPDGAVRALRVAAVCGDAVRISRNVELLPLARRALELARPTLPEETLRWGVQVIGRFAIATKQPDLLEELLLWAEELQFIDPGPGHYWVAVFFAQQGRRLDAWVSLTTASKYLEDALVRAAQDPDFAPLREGYGDFTYFRPIPGPDNTEELP